VLFIYWLGCFVQALVLCLLMLICVLRFADCDFGDEGAVVMESLKGHPALQHLELMGSFLDCQKNSMLLLLLSLRGCLFCFRLWLILCLLAINYLYQCVVQNVA